MTLSLSAKPSAASKVTCETHHFWPDQLWERLFLQLIRPGPPTLWKRLPPSTDEIRPAHTLGATFPFD